MTAVRLLRSLLPVGLLLTFSGAAMSADRAPTVSETVSAEWEVGVGAINSFETDTYATVFARRHFAWQWHGIRLWAGGTAMEGGAFWLGGGLRYDVRLGKDWRIGLSSGPGYFNESDELDLGHELEFHSVIELVRAVGSRGSVVAGVGHISNAGLGDDNPGATTYRLSYRWRQ